MIQAPRDEARRLAQAEIRGAFKPEALHTYTDEKGDALYWRIRARLADGSKWIRPMRRNGNGFELKEPVFPNDKPLYRLHGLAAKPGAPCWFAEGENCADAIAKRGLLATTAGGATSDGCADFSPLAGRTVTIWPDADKPGLDHGERVAEKLRALGCNVETIDAAALGLPEGGDCVDWLKANPNATAADFAKLPRMNAARGSDTAASGDREHWPEPQPLPEVPPVEPFDFRYLPGALHAFVQDIAERMQCPPEFPAVATLVMVGAAIGRRVAIRPRKRTDWLVVPNLWGVLVGKPGVMKSPALGEALAPLKALQAQAFEDYEQARQEFEISEHAAKLRAEAREKAARAALKDSASVDVTAILAPDDEPEEPRAKRYITNDPTVEALAEILEDNPNGILLERDELIGWLRDLEREGRQSDRAFYLTAADGDKPFTVDRIMRGKGRHVEALCVAMLGGIQPDVLAEFVRYTQRGAGGDGLLQRFGLMVYPDVAPWQNIDRYPNTEARDAVRMLIERLIGLDAAAIGATRDEYRGLSFLPFTDQAQALFDEWFAELEGRLRSDDEHPAMTAHLAKYRKLVPALALIGHLSECEGGSVSEPALARALALAEYLEGHARRVYAVAVRPELDAARSLLAKLRAGKLAIDFKPRDVYRKGWAGLATPDQVAAALRVLREFDWLCERHEETGGRPSLVYRAHPAAKGAA